MDFIKLFKKMVVLFLLVVSLTVWSNDAQNIHNYTTLQGDTIIGSCLIFPAFHGRPNTMCESFQNKVRLATLSMIEISPPITTLQCSTKVNYQYLEDFTFPYFKDVTTLPTLCITFCPYPQTTYAEVIKKTNISSDHLLDLDLENLPFTPPIKTSLLDGLNIARLRLKYKEGIASRPVLPTDVVEYVSKLTSLEIQGAELPSFPNDTRLEKLTLDRGASLGDIGGCSSLKELVLDSWDVRRLTRVEGSDAGWVTSCTNLHDIYLRGVSVDTLHRVLTNARSIRKLEISLIPDSVYQFNIGITNALYLERVKITKTKIYHFHLKPAGFPMLQEVDLSNNNIRKESIKYLHDFLQHAFYVQNFTFSDNPILDMCDHDLDIPEWKLDLPKLMRLVAVRGATSRLCFKLLMAPSLKLLDLSQCNVSTLEFSDLPNLPHGQLELRLENNKIEQVTFSGNNPKDEVKVPQELSIRELHLAGNWIRNFTAKSLPDELKLLDLANNRLSYVDGATAAAFFTSPERKIRLTGNAIVCDCKNHDFLKTLRDHSDQVEDYDKLTCAKDGQPLYNVTLSALCEKEIAPQSIVIRVVLPVLLVFVAITALAIAVHFRYGQSIKIFLYARGLCLCWLKEDKLDANRPFDVFISFSHDDEEYVVKELIPDLEKSNYKTCIHMRDWIIGEWIPKQISVSIDISRRTLIVLSRNFVKSAWGMLEFRMAHASMLSEGRARLIVVVLDDVVTDESLDPELKAYLRTNTYLKTDDPWFWDKLKYALPRHGHVVPTMESQEIPTGVGPDFGPYGSMMSVVNLRGERAIEMGPAI